MHRDSEAPRPTHALSSTDQANHVASSVSLVHITTVPATLAFLLGQIEFMQSRGFQVILVASGAAELERFGQKVGASVRAVGLTRTMSPLRDLRTTIELARLLRELRPTIVHAHTPKAGLLGMIAARLCGVPVRIYHIHGFPFLTKSGFRRWILRTTERLSCRFAHRVLCVSRSVASVAVQARICSPSKIKVLGRGSINGVDAQRRFNPELLRRSRESLRRRLGVSDSTVVVGFVGRVVRDKGIHDLWEAWRIIREDVSDCILVLIGPSEPYDPIDPDVLRDMQSDPRVRLLGPTDAVAEYMAALDLVVLPSHREGFPVVPLEAAAMRLPVVATRIPGNVDAIVDGVTGTLVPPRDARALAGAIKRYLASEALRSEHGSAARSRVLREFRPEGLWSATYDEYVQLMGLQRANARPA